MKYILLILMVVLSGCIKESDPNDCSEACQNKERLMCGDGLVRERCVGCPQYYKAICYTDHALNLQSLYFKKDGGDRLKKHYRKEGIPHCSEVNEPYLKHPFVEV